MRELYLAGGCFWGLEKYIQSINGVAETIVGYVNGKTLNPSYEEVCYHDTGHAEAIKVVYDEAVLPLELLLNIFYEAIDPTSVNRQGNDVGTQYRTGIYYTDENDREKIVASLRALQQNYTKPIAIEEKPLENFSMAEEYHQKYLDKNPGGYCHIGKALFDKAAKANRGYVKKNPQELKSTLSEMQYHVTQNNGTEPPFHNEYWNEHRKGIYVDITTGEPLFISSDKFDSGCGWPSFAKPIDANLVYENTDTTHGMVRREVRSALGEAHLGHVFEDGPHDMGGLRYCINSAALRFIPLEDMEREGYGWLIGMLTKKDENTL